MNYWKKIIEEKRASKTHLQYNTNLTILPQKVLSLWKHFKSIELSVSLDGIGKVNDLHSSP